MNFDVPDLVEHEELISVFEAHYRCHVDRQNFEVSSAARS